jgi:hypothetical protein
MDDDARFEVVRRLLHDDSLEVADRVLGATLSEDGQDAEGGDGGGARPNDRSSRDVR